MQSIVTTGRLVVVVLFFQRRWEQPLSYLSSTSYSLYPVPPSLLLIYFSSSSNCYYLSSNVELLLFVVERRTATICRQTLFDCCFMVMISFTICCICCHIHCTLSSYVSYHPLVCYCYYSSYHPLVCYCYVVLRYAM
jgi:hypothetical protein